MKALGVGFVAMAALAVSGCGYARGDESGGQMVQRSYNVGPFQQIEVAGPYDVEVTTGGAPGVSASGPQHVIDQLVVEVRGNKLLIHPKEHWGFLQFGGWHSDGNVTIQVKAPALTSAAVAGSGDLRIDKVAGNSFDGSLAGSGDLTLGQVAVQALKLSIGGSGDLKAISGQAANADYSVAGSGGLDARGVRVQIATARMAGSGDINGQVTGNADVHIVGSGDVTLTGGAKCSVSKVGSGDANCS